LVIKVFQQLAEEEGRTIVCVTHDDSVAAGAQRRIRMRDGRIISDET
jgi:putative ABC transport system ATP-binding protein